MGRRARTFGYQAPPPRPAQVVEVDDVERRLIRAWRLDYAMRDRERGFLTVRSCWPAYQHDRADLNCQAENATYLDELRRQQLRVRGWDTRAARDDYDAVMEWMRPMLRREQEVLKDKPEVGKRGLLLREFCRLVACEFSFQTIGDEDGTSKSQAARRWDGIVEACHAIANGWDGKLRSGRV